MAELIVYAPRYRAQIATALAECLDGLPNVRVIEDRRTAGPNRRRTRHMVEGRDRRGADRRGSYRFVVPAVVRL